MRLVSGQLVGEIGRIVAAGLYFGLWSYFLLVHDVTKAVLGGLGMAVLQTVFAALRHRRKA